MIDILMLPFIQTALLSGMLAGLTCSYLGVFVVLRRIVFIGIALAQISALGVACGVYLEKDPCLFSFVFTVIGVVILSAQSIYKRLTAEALIGVSFASAWAFSILILSKAAHGEADMLTIVQGNILGASFHDIQHLLYVFIPTLIIHAVFYRNFIFSAFDPETAKTMGINSGFWNFLFFLTLGVCISEAISVCGVLLTFSLLLIPPACGVVIGKSMKSDFIISALVAAICVFSGIMLSFVWDLPTGPSITGVLAVIFCLILFLSGLFSKLQKKKSLEV